MPLVLDDFSAPDPDIAVVIGTLLDYLHAHPTHAVLIVEVADSSLRHDRERKRIRYANAQIPEIGLSICRKTALKSIVNQYRAIIVYRLFLIGVSRWTWFLTRIYSFL